MFESRCGVRCNSCERKSRCIVLVVLRWKSHFGECQVKFCCEEKRWTTVEYVQIFHVRCFPQWEQRRVLTLLKSWSSADSGPRNLKADRECG